MENARVYCATQDQLLDPVDRDLGYDTVPERDNQISLLQEVRRIRDILLKSEDKRSIEEEKNLNLKEWRIIACVTDRIFFVIYVTLNVVIIALLFTVM